MDFPTHRIAGHYLADSLPDSRRFLRNWERIFQQFDTDYPTVLANAIFWVQHSDKPWIGLNHLERFLDSLSEPSTLFDFLESYPSAFEILWNALSKAPYIAELLIRNPEDFYWLIEESSLGRDLERTALQRQFENTVLSFESPYRRHSFLHRLHRRHFLRIAIRDLLEISDFERTTTDLSNLAETLIRIVTRMVTRSFAAKDRLPDSQFTVIALGKLGGAELNYSSDIDLMFIYDKDGKLPSGESYNAAYQKIAEEICRILNEQSEHGMLYRVDTRLRPDGTSGILCQSLSAYLHYYEIRGRLWERQMLLKARPVSGDIQFGEEALRRFEPFIFPKSIQSPLEEVVGMRKKSETITSDGLNVKSDPGGIRDIEFIVQALHLQFGGKNPDIRSGNSVKSLKKLSVDDRYLTTDESLTLQAAYKFLRQIEHALQLQENRQTHILPREEPDNQLIASSIKFDDYDTLYQKATETMEVIRDIYNSVFDITSEAGGDDYSNYSDEDWYQYFSDAGFSEPRKAATQIQSLATGKFPNHHDAPTREAFWDLCPTLLSQLEDQPAPAQALTDFERVLRSYYALGSLYKIFTSNPEVLSLFLRLISVAPKVIPWIIQQPGLLDTLISLPSDSIPDDHFPEIYARLSHREIDEDNWLEEAQNLHHDVLLTVIIHWIANHMTLQETQAQFAIAHRALISASLDYWLQDYREDLCVIIAGSAATNSMVFSSDLDLVFLVSKTDIYTEITEAVQEYVATLQQYTVQGRLVSFDFRLRPEGSSSPLIMPVNDYKHYIRERMSGWEFQAMTKAYHLWGERSLWNNASELLDEQVHNRISKRNFWDSLLEWEATVNRQKRSTKGFDFSFQAGGYFPVRNSLEWVDLPGVQVSGDSVYTLREVYAFYQRLRWFLGLFVEGSINSVPIDAQKRDYLAVNAGFGGPESLEETVRETLQRGQEANTTLRKKLLQEFT
ncbi:MAG: hypothetical protein K9N46_03255 [Candidatus Marinimicrobia bacterium]|nr:hypothetical protein [Candidatus Neomarinimicrobiota bacterium]MCF7828084.1 hypothetical protein [Candidatus Neomarinimicrobiota bacterium]MCF7879741.1 hypothetical protein [Candidatus Neomarinimicrobiota bacterium]